MAGLDENALITLEDLKTYLEKSDDNHDPILEMIINSVSSFFDKYVDFQLKQKTYTDLYLDGNGQEELWLSFYPVASITSLKENDIALTEGTDEDYIQYLEEGLLVRIGVWLKGRKKIKISCSGGFATIPKDLQLACMQQCAVEFQRLTKKEWGETSRSFPDGSVSISIEENLLSYVKEVLDRYRRII